MTFDAEAKRDAEKILARYPEKRSAILPLAQLAMDIDGFVSKQAMEEIAEMTAAPPVEVKSTVTFYSMLKTEPVGKLIVSVCTNVSCMVLGGEALLEELRQHYLLDEDVHVEEVECIAACDGAPCAQVNYDFHLGLNPAKAIGIIEEYKQGKLRARTVSGNKAKAR